MNNINIENTWESDNISREKCKCGSGYSNNCNSIKTVCMCEDYINREHEMPKYIFNSISCGTRLFTDNLYAVKYPNLIITNTYNTEVRSNLQIRHLHIFDTIQNKIIFSSKNNLSEANQELIKRVKSNPHYPNKNFSFQYHSSMMMKNFIIIKFTSVCIRENHLESHLEYRAYIIFNFNTHTYKLFMFCELYMYNDRTLFVFVFETKSNPYENSRYNYKIITKSDIDNNINNIIEINFHKEERAEILCMCNYNILIFRLAKMISNIWLYSSVYCDITKQKNIYTSKNEFIGWRGNRFIEYDKELKKCNLISFISDHIQKKIINCNRCLDKFEESSEQIIPEHKNICSLCRIKL